MSEKHIVQYIEDDELLGLHKSSDCPCEPTLIESWSKEIGTPVYQHYPNSIKMDDARRWGPAEILDNE